MVNVSIKQVEFLCWGVPVFDLMWLSLLIITENAGNVYFIIQIVPY